MCYGDYHYCCFIDEDVLKPHEEKESESIISLRNALRTCLK